MFIEEENNNSNNTMTEFIQLKRKKNKKKIANIFTELEQNGMVNENNFTK